MATDFSKVFFRSLSEINASLRKKEYSAVELTKAFCDRLEEYGPKYNALSHSMRKKALKQAKDVDDDIKIDRTRGPLQGIPFGVKDLLAVKRRADHLGRETLRGSGLQLRREYRQEARKNRARF